MHRGRLARLLHRHIRHGRQRKIGQNRVAVPEIKPAELSIRYYSINE
jgi:hypothetical protein